MNAQAQVQQMREVLSAAGLSIHEVWVSYRGLGVTVSPLGLEAYLDGLLVLQEEECDVLADAINELLVKVGAGARIPRCSADSARQSLQDSRRALGARSARRGRSFSRVRSRNRSA